VAYGQGQQPSTTKNSASRRFNVRGGSLNNSSNNQALPATGGGSQAQDINLSNNAFNNSQLRSGSNQNNSTIHSNPHSQREQPLSKGQMQLQKYTKSNNVDNVTSFSGNDLNLPYPGPGGGANVAKG